MAVWVYADSVHGDLGNSITILGRDEGVPYDQLFASGGRPAEAAIGGMPLLMHTVSIVLALIALRLASATKRKLLLYALYWFVVINMAKLVAYIWMRPFISTGDTGRFNQGFGVSPIYLFLVGTLFLLCVITSIAGTDHRSDGVWSWQIMGPPYQTSNRTSARRAKLAHCGVEVFTRTYQVHKMVEDYS